MSQEQPEGFGKYVRHSRICHLEGLEPSITFRGTLVVTVALACFRIRICGCRYRGTFGWGGRVGIQQCLVSDRNVVFVYLFVLLETVSNYVL